MKKHKLSQLIEKSESRLRAIITKHFARVNELRSIVDNAEKFNIPISIVSTNAINERIKQESSEIAKVIDVLNFKFNDGYKGGLNSCEYYKDGDMDSLKLSDELNDKAGITGYKNFWWRPETQERLKHLANHA